MEKITILLVDDHKLIRESWAILLNNDPRMSVVGETGNAADALTIAKIQKPHIILMDINMTPLNGFEATQLLQKNSPQSKIIGITMHTMPSYAKKMMQLGAMGYVTKNSTKEELLFAIQEVYAGKKYICEEVKDILAQQELGNGSNLPDINILSKRELDIVKLIKEGLSSKEIAERLDLSLKTVEVHRYNILKKLNIKNTALLINYINNQGLL